MCKYCDAGLPQNHSTSRRDFLVAAAMAPLAATGIGLSGTSFAADGGRPPPRECGREGQRYVIRGGAVMSLDPSVGDFPVADVLIEGKKIVAVGPNLNAGSAAVIDARGSIVMPGFVDTHHHQFETALRGYLADGLLINDQSNTPSGNTTYYETILLKFAPVYRPEDVYVNELFGALSQLDCGVTTVFDVSQIHHTPEHSDAAIQALIDSGRRSAFGYFEGAGNNPPQYAYPQDAYRINQQWFASTDQLVSMIMGGEVYLGTKTYTASWGIGRDLGLQVAAHILSPFGIRPTFDLLAEGHGGTDGTLAMGSDNLFIHVTGMSDMAWQKVRDLGAQVSIAFPIEMNMRHGMPPILKMQSLGLEPSLSTDVECTMTADFFTQMRSCMTLQRALVNQMILDTGLPPNPLVSWPTAPFPAEIPKLITTRDVLRYATLNGAKALRLDAKVGSISPGKEADIILLDATRINVAPLNHVPGAVVSLMDRTNVDTVIVAGKVRKWKGRLLDVDLPHLFTRLLASRDYVFAAAGIPRDLFGSQ